MRVQMASAFALGSSAARPQYGVGDGVGSAALVFVLWLLILAAKACRGSGALSDHLQLQKIAGRCSVCASVDTSRKGCAMIRTRVRNRNPPKIAAKWLTETDAITEKCRASTAGTPRDSRSSTYASMQGTVAQSHHVEFRLWRRYARPQLLRRQRLRASACKSCTSLIKVVDPVRIVRRVVVREAAQYLTIAFHVKLPVVVPTLVC